MPRKQTPEPLPPPKLTVPRDEAAAKINTQIGVRPSRERIKQLLGININPAEFAEAMRELK